MKLFALLILSLFLVSCGNEYGIGKGTKVMVGLTTTKNNIENVTLHKVTSKMLILKTRSGKTLSIPKDTVRWVQERE